MSQRTERVDELLRQEIGALLTRDVADPGLGFATVTRVETTPDLAHARVWVSVIGQPAERSTTLAALRRAMPYIRHQLGERLRIRRIPDLHVELDETAERGTRVLQLLREIEEGRLPDDAPPVGESLPTPTARLPREGETPTTSAGARPPAKRRRTRPRPEGGPGRSGTNGPGSVGESGGPGGARGTRGAGTPGGRRTGGSGRPTGPPDDRRRGGR